MTTADELLTIGEAAQLLGCSESSIYAHLNAGRLPSERVVDERDGVQRLRRLIPRSALEQLHATDRRGGWRHRVSDEELRQAIVYLQEGLDSEEAGKRVGITGRAIRKRLAALGLRESDFRPLPADPPALDPHERRRRLALLAQERQWEREREQQGTYAYSRHHSDRRRDLHLMLTPEAWEEVHAEAERRRCSMSSLVADVLYEAGIIAEA